MICPACRASQMRVCATHFFRANNHETEESMENLHLKDENRELKSSLVAQLAAAEQRATEAERALKIETQRAAGWLSPEQGALKDARIARLTEALRLGHALLEAMVDDAGEHHDDDCALDDSCRCDLVQRFNAAHEAGRIALAAHPTEANHE